MILAGRLKHSVSVERMAHDVNDYNELDGAWQTLFSARASIEPLNGKEYFTASGEHSEVTTRIRLRWQQLASDVAPNDRVNQDGRIYDVLSVINPQEGNRELVLMCKRAGTD